MGLKVTTDQLAEWERRGLIGPTSPKARVISWRGSCEIAIDGMKLKSELNRSRQEHWASIRKRVKAQHDIVNLLLSAWSVPPLTAPLRVIFIRLYGGRMKAMDEGDNLNSAFKACRDAVAHWLGRDDGDGTVKWEYHQMRSDWLGVKIRIEELT